MRKTLGLLALLAATAVGCSGEFPQAEDEPRVVSEPLIGAPAKPLRTIAGLMFDLGSGPPDKAAGSRSRSTRSA